MVKARKPITKEIYEKVLIKSPEQMEIAKLFGFQNAGWPSRENKRKGESLEFTEQPILE